MGSDGSEPLPSHLNYPMFHPIRGLFMFFTNCCSSSQILWGGVSKETAMGGSCFLGDLLQG